MKLAVLHVDDDEALRAVVAAFLEDEGCRVTSAGTRAAMLDALDAEKTPDVILLDLSLPDSDGFSILSDLRQRKVTSPVIITSGKTQTTERIIGIEMGADDYMTKPFDLRELTARIRAVTRRRTSPVPQGMTDPGIDPDPKPASIGAGESSGPPEGSIRFCDGMTLDPGTYEVYDRDGSPLHFTSGEFKLLENLLKARNRVLTREQLFDGTREGEFLPFDRAIDVQISRIRKKLKDEARTPPLIKTIRGVGYMLCDRPTEKQSAMS